MSNQEILKELDNNLDLDNKNIIIFGVGNTSFLYQRCIEREKINVYAYCDNNQSKIGKNYFNKTVISVNDINNIKNPYVLICTAHMKFGNEIKMQLNDLKIPNSFIDEYVFKKNKDKILKVLNLLEDDLSKETYLNMIYCRMMNTKVPEHIYRDNTYFCVKEFMENSSNEVFVDLGAYVGDTIEKYLFVHDGVFKKIYAFEPELDLYKALEVRTKRLIKEWNLDKNSIILSKKAIGKNIELLGYNNTHDSIPLGTVITNNKNDMDVSIEGDTLDNCFKNEKISFIKTDIESSEYDMILGGKEVIKRDKPLMAICLHHNASDMLDIPIMLSEINKDYSFKIRHHSYNYLEIILYAVNN